VIIIDSNVVSEMMRDVTRREGAGRPISAADAQIAAICAAHDATLATRNTDDFEITGVALINPWDG
jgi:predicted nucleic acid-binding protein